MTKVNGNPALQFQPLKCGFKCDHTSLEDDRREGQPKNATTPETIEKVQNIVLDDRLVKVNAIADAMGEGCKIAFVQRIRDVKALCKVGNAFVEFRSKTNVQMTFASMYVPIQ